jgi:hypothetical protein
MSRPYRRRRRSHSRLANGSTQPPAGTVIYGVRPGLFSRGLGESPGGVAPPVALRTGRDSLPSSGVGLLSLMVTWWFHPIDRVNANQFVATGVRGSQHRPDRLCRFRVRSRAGVLIRRTVPAMATTIIGFVAARLAFTHWIRPHLLAAAHAVTPLSSASNIGFQGDPSGAVTFIATNPHIPNAWTISSRIVDNAARTPTTQTLHTFLQRICPNIGAAPNSGGTGRPAPTTFQDCIAHLSAKFHLAVTYQPASRY